MHRLFLSVAVWAVGGLLFLPSSLGAVTIPARPTGNDFFVDEAFLLTPGDREQINRVASELLRDQKIPFFVVTIRSLVSQKAVGLSVKDYTQKVFDDWGIGSQARNYGILLLVSEGDREARIELGKAWAGTHDGDASYVMDELMVPRFKAGDYSGGITQGVLALDKMARGLGLPAPRRAWWVLPALIGGILGVVAVAVSLMRSGKAGWGWALLALLGAGLFFLMRSGSSGNSGSFGGGSSGGGGASGKW